MKPIIYISSERSGTNFFRNIMNAHSKVYFPHNPVVYDDFKRFEDRYETKDEFVFDTIGLIRLNHDPWDYIPEEEEVLKRLTSISVLELEKVVFDLCSRHYNTPVVGIKNIHYTDEVKNIYNVFDTPKFICQYRDPRDCAASWLTINSGPKHVYFAAKRWNDEQNKALLAIDTEIKDGDSLLVSYESLVSDSKNSIQRVCDFLELGFEGKMLEFHKTKEAKKSAQMHKAWNNLAKPIMTNNYNKYKDKLSDDQIYIIERVCYKNMNRLGYELENKSFLKEDPGCFSEKEIANFEKVNQERRKENFESSVRNYRKERKDYYRSNIKQKFN